MKKGKKLAEGKTKIIWGYSDDDSKVLIESKPDITAGDGKKRDKLKNKDIYSTTTTCNIFSFLLEKRVPNHFIMKTDEKTFLAYRLKMIPLELVARRIATGSYLQRHPEIKEGTRLEDKYGNPITEFFLKDDSAHDPLFDWNPQNDQWELYSAHQPAEEGFIRNISAGEMLKMGITDLYSCNSFLVTIFNLIEAKWREQNVLLADLKVECGFNKQGKMLIGDVIDNDSWRIWVGGKKSGEKSKQLYRERGLTSKLKKNYQWVAEATAKFLE